MLTPHLITDRATWHAALTQLPYAHILQTWEWGEFKQQTTGWQPQRFAYSDSNGTIRALASVLTRRAAGFKVIYVPKGPVLDYADSEVRNAVLNHLQKLARFAIWLKIDPDLPLGIGIPNSAERPPSPNPLGEALQLDLLKRGWQFSASQVQFRNTLTLDLTQSEDELLSGMSQGTRRKIRQAEKAGVIVRSADLRIPQDLETLYQLYQITGQRQGFIIRPLDYYRLAWQTMAEAGLAQAFLAELDGQALSGLILFLTPPKAWYFYGMSSNEGREAQPNYLLQWTAIRWAKAQGFPVYDWWGAPNEFDEDDPMWGVYRFKDGFGGEVVRHLGAWDYVSFWPIHWAYEKVLPRLLNWHKTSGGGDSM